MDGNHYHHGHHHHPHAIRTPPSRMLPPTEMSLADLTEAGLLFGDKARSLGLVPPVFAGWRSAVAPPHPPPPSHGPPPPPPTQPPPPQALPPQPPSAAFQAELNAGSFEFFLKKKKTFENVENPILAETDSIFTKPHR